MQKGVNDGYVYRILRKIRLEHWQAIQLANNRCGGYWRMVEMLNTKSSADTTWVRDAMSIPTKSVER